MVTFRMGTLSMKCLAAAIFRMQATAFLARSMMLAEYPLAARSNSICCIMSLSICESLTLPSALLATSTLYTRESYALGFMFCFFFSSRKTVENAAKVTSPSVIAFRFFSSALIPRRNDLASFSVLK